MPSSTSSSKSPGKSKPTGVLAREGALPAGLRLTASDRPGQAQPVPTRDIPKQPWGRLALTAVVALFVGLSALEWNARRIGLHAGDLDNSEVDWANERMRSAGAAAAIVGDSRILFDTDLDRFERLTGVRPIQLAIHGTSALTLLEDVASNPKFTGLLIVGLSDTMFFQPFDGYGGYIHKRTQYESPAKRASAVLDHALQRRLAYLDSNHRLSVVAARLDPGFRHGVDGPYDDVWKVQEVGEHRATHMWPKVVTDPRVRAHARFAWKGFKEEFPYTPQLIAKGQARAVTAVATIRARGGDVVFIRPPSDIHLRVNEEAQVPKAKGWTMLLRNTHAIGIHNDDLPPAVHHLIMPEWSHLSRACATVFTDAYVRRLAALTPRLRLRADAPPPLTRDDCVPPGQH
ncbi:hypothetical protein [Sphingomonas sp.]|uniref:hypothetical protein n=1 Tax=Sphingomonas sp. TaxID=28214 RepID=UPI00286AF603|nr:hypothetical protein [Sphingomonas sp.]